MENLKIKGIVHYLHKNAQGEVVSEETRENVITNTGLAAMAGLVGNTGAVNAFTFLALGSDATAAAAAQTALLAEISADGWERAAATVSRVTTTVTNDTLQLVNVFSFTGTQTVREVGVFNAGSAGVMLARQVPTEKAMTDGDTLTITYQIRFA